MLSISSNLNRKLEGQNKKDENRLCSRANIIFYAEFLSKNELKTQKTPVKYKKLKSFD